MKSVLDDVRREPRPKMWQKCERLYKKTYDERFTMFATLSDCRMKRASEFCRMGSTCGALHQNLCQGYWAVTKRNIALLSALSSRNRPKTTPTLSPPSLLVTNLECLGTTLRLISSRFSGRLQLQRDRRKHEFGAMWNPCWFFFYNEGIMNKEFVPPGQTVKGKLYCEVVKRLRENFRLKLPDKCHKNFWVLHHDNAPAHASLVVQQFWASTNKMVIQHPPYSPELALL